MGINDFLHGNLGMNRLRIDTYQMHYANDHFAFQQQGSAYQDRSVLDDFGKTVNRGPILLPLWHSTPGL